MPPLVSIITPSYNQGAYLADTIDSVLAQNYPHIEYGIVDGGSTDGSVDLIRKYESRLDWWISEPDEGQAHAINKGMNKVQGEIVAWINSDDFYLPHAVDRAVRVFEQQSAGMVFGDGLTVDAKGYPLNRLSPGEWGLSDLMRFRIICQPAVFFRRDVWQEAEGLDPTFHYMLDHQLWIKIAAQHAVVHVEQLLAASRHHASAKNVASASGFSEEIFRLLSWMEHHPLLGDLYDQDRRKILGGAYRLSARYLLEDNKPRQAVDHYLKALRRWPAYASRHWHRILFGVVSMLTGFNIDDLPPKRSAPPGREYPPEWRDWPGLKLENG